MGIEVRRASQTKKGTGALRRRSREREGRLGPGCGEAMMWVLGGWSRGI